MNENYLGNVLWDMYCNASKGEQVTQIHLFGIKYAKYIFDYNLSVRKILISSKLQKSYYTEISKGIKLSKYVTIKDN